MCGGPHSSDYEEVKWLLKLRSCAHTGIFPLKPECESFQKVTFYFFVNKSQIIKMNTNV